jgi:hypothetical protein
VPWFMLYHGFKELEHIQHIHRNGAAVSTRSDRLSICMYTPFTSTSGSGAGNAGNMRERGQRRRLLFFGLNRPNKGRPTLIEAYRSIVGQGRLKVSAL